MQAEKENVMITEEDSKPRSEVVPSEEKWSLQSFDLGLSLGKGRFGLVYKAREKKSMTICAIKIMFKKQIVAQDMLSQLKREIEYHARLRHRHVLRLYGYFHDEQRVYLVMELADKGELYKILKKLPENKLPEEKAARYIFQLSGALQYLHSKGLIHRDIKPENLLLNKKDEIKIADFGWCVLHKTGISSNRRETICGTLDYLPPEMIVQQEQGHDHNVDIWSLGVLLYEFLVGKAPFEATEEDDTRRRIAAVNYSVPSSVSANARDLISKLLVAVPRNRLQLDQVLLHPFLSTVSLSTDYQASASFAKAAETEADSSNSTAGAGSQQ
jgi:serine/threonine protein kinase